MRPDISIIIPVFNAQDTLKTSIKSIINFDDTNEVEIVLIDGGSKESLKNNIKRNLRESDQFIYEKDWW